MTKYGFASVCAVGAAIVAYSGHDGWGWLIFLAFIVL
jgi:hypothetical protein